MAQAERITTAIRDLMSRGQPPQSTSPVRAAHSEFIAALAGNVPQPIRSNAESEEGGSDHLEKLFAPLHVYVAAIIADAAQKSPGSTLDRRYLDNLFQEWLADALGLIRNAAAEMREHENWRVL